MIENIILHDKITGIRIYAGSLTRSTLDGYLAFLKQTLTQIGGSVRITVEPLTPQEWQEARGRRRCPKCEEKARKEIILDEPQ